EAEPKELPEDVGSDDCLASYTHIYSPDLLRDQVAFITGGGSGIGLRIAEIFMSLIKCFLAVLFFKCTTTCADSKRNAFFFDTDAAGNFLCPASALSFNAFKTVLEIDTMGTFNTSKVVYEKWFKDHGGNIVNISATLAYRGQALQVHAGSAKAANDAMTKHLAVEWGPSGVRVNAVAPGPISGTEGFRRLGGSGAEAAGSFQSIPLQRAGNKTEMAHCTLFLASRASSYMTGAVLVADGGAWLTSANDVSALLGIASSKSAKL
uniref:Peroxisomal 2,4-dienoyl-CoA reductase [(3E)-enoyl-CoA-producing] n=1 Tax=Fundulus heteroclitus TaxID=8078 RepID=A0A3Q2NQ04_FUNHE